MNPAATSKDNQQTSVKMPENTINWMKRTIEDLGLPSEEENSDDYGDYDESTQDESSAYDEEELMDKAG